MVTSTNRVLRIVGEVKESPGGDDALVAVLDGTLSGFSIHARIVRYVGYGERDGIPVITVTEAELVSVAMSPHSADGPCLIERCCDVVPAYRVQAEWQERERLLRSLRPVPSLAAETGYAWEVGFGPR